jgi:hypothetical protein
MIIYRQHGLQKKYCKAEQYCFGARGQAETSLKIVDSNSISLAHIYMTAHFPDLVQVLQ